MVAKAVESRAAGDAAETERPAPQATYEVAVASANIRLAPSMQAQVLAEVKRGTRLHALAAARALAEGPPRGRHRLGEPAPGPVSQRRQPAARSSCAGPSDGGPPAATTRSRPSALAW